MNEQKQKYGLFTAITMIIGICIGSGIFFKSDNILVATGGSIFLGVLVFVIGAVAIVFGGLCLGELAARTDKPGGIITYADEFVSKRWACGYGWFQVFVYFPSLSAVVAWVVGIYTCVLFNIDGSLELQILIGTGFFALCFLYNTISAKLGGIFQNAATAIKLVPLILLGIAGFVFGDPIEGLMKITTAEVMGAGWISAIGAIAFSYDGWVVSTSIAHEVRNSKKNMSKALILAPIFVMVVYVLYFVGVSSYIGVDQVMALQDAHVAVAATQLFGSGFAKAITVFVLISVMGTVNGLVLGYIRVPYSISLRHGMMPGARVLSKVNAKLQMPVNSAILAFAFTCIWMTAHYITTKFNILANSDLSEISIAISYLLYVVLYVQVFKMFRKGEIKSVFRGVVCPVMATLGALFILSGGLQNAYFVYYTVFCLLVVVGALLYYNKTSKAA